MSPILGLLLGLGGALITGIVTLTIARRNTSGDAGKSDAKTLWDAAQEMRQELRDEVVELRKQVAGFEGKVDLLTQQNATLTQQHADCQQNELALRKRVEDLEQAVERRAPRRRS